ncbi:RNA-binding protein squid-like [Periplaneta americana]|uniref:RNA-binding protein squid-like n=1 Tax=Periplaneta americana TaxID=6978 RepID=UPI0037E954B5
MVVGSKYTTNDHSTLRVSTAVVMGSTPIVLLLSLIQFFAEDIQDVGATPVWVASQPNKQLNLLTRDSPSLDVNANAIISKSETKSFSYSGPEIQIQNFQSESESLLISSVQGDQLKKNEEAEMSPSLDRQRHVKEAENVSNSPQHEAVRVSRSPQDYDDDVEETPQRRGNRGCGRGNGKAKGRGNGKGNGRGNGKGSNNGNKDKKNCPKNSDEEENLNGTTESRSEKNVHLQSNQVHSIITETIYRKVRSPQNRDTSVLTEDNDPINVNKHYVHSPLIRKLRHVNTQNNDDMRGDSIQLSKPVGSREHDKNSNDQLGVDVRKEEQKALSSNVGQMEDKKIENCHGGFSSWSFGWGGGGSGGGWGWGWGGNGGGGGWGGGGNGGGGNGGGGGGGGIPGGGTGGGVDGGGGRDGFGGQYQRYPARIMIPRRGGGRRRGGRRRLTSDEIDSGPSM